MATLAFVHAVFLRTIKGTAIYDNSSLIVQRTFSVRNIINPTRSRDGQVTIVQDGVIIHVGQGHAVQVESNDLACGNGNVFLGILQQGDGVAGISGRNSISQRVVIRTCIGYRSILALNYSIGIVVFSRSGITSRTEVCALRLCLTICRIECHKDTTGDAQLGRTISTIGIVQVQHKFVSLGGIRILLLNAIGATLNIGRAGLNVYRMNVTDKGAVFNRQLRTFILNIHRVAIVLFGL